MYRLICLSIFVSGAIGSVVRDGLCDFSAIGGFVTDLNLTQMFGTWNQIARIDNEQELGQCSSAKMEGTFDGNGMLNSVQVSFFEVVDKNKTHHNGTIEAFPVIQGLFYMNVPGFLEGPFVVQATNYKDYAILYSCLTLTVANETLNTTNTKVVYAWQYNRKTELSSSEQGSINELVNVNPDLNGTTWKTIAHDKKSCGNAGVTLAVPQLLIVLVTMFISKDFI